jgi:hypothetical protein
MVITISKQTYATNDEIFKMKWQLSLLSLASLSTVLAVPMGSPSGKPPLCLQPEWNCFKGMESYYNIAWKPVDKANMK